MADETLQAKIDAAKSLHDYDHAFVSPEGVEHFARTFGVTLRCYVEKASPNAVKGLTLNGGAKEASGMCAAQMAESICEQLGVKYMDKYGRGSQLHECAARLTEHFEQLKS